MIGVLGYVLGCLLIAGLVTFVIAVCRPLRSGREFVSWRVLIFLFVVALAGPYVYAEVMTLAFGKGMQTAIRDVLAEVGVQGEVQYYKVLSYNGEHARIVVVAQEKGTYGNDERPVLGIDIAKGARGWEAVNYDVVSSYKRGEDGVTLPPYW